MLKESISLTGQPKVDAEIIYQQLKAKIPFNEFEVIFFLYVWILPWSYEHRKIEMCCSVNRGNNWR